MFWRFGGYANISTIDTILDKPDFALEDLLDESDLIQELKQHNTKLIEYLREDKILEKLLDYVVAPKLEAVDTPPTHPITASAEDESKNKNRLLPFSRPRASSHATDATDTEEDEQEKKRNRYAFVACEVLSSDTWSIYEALTENRQLIRSFWEFLSRPAPLDPLQASYFTKVNESLFEKKTEEMMELLRELPDAVPNLIKHVESPMVMDLLLKIIALDRSEGGQGVVEWLYSKDIIPALLSYLGPEHSWVVQTAAGDFIKAIITISANASQNEQQCIGPNELTRQLVSKPCAEQLIGYMLGGGNPLTVGVGIVIEVIRKNNSDYDPDVGSESNATPSSRDPIYLGILLRLFAENVPKFMKVKAKGQSDKERVESTFGEKLEPLGFDRFKTCELMAELLHCSNMGLLNEVGAEQLIATRDTERQRLRLEGKLAPLKDDDLSVDDLTMRIPQSSPDETRRLEVTNADEDGFEEVEPSKDMHEDTSDDFVQPEGEAAASSASPFLEKDEDEFVDEPLSSPRLAVAADKINEQQFDEPDLVVAPLSPSKPKSAEPTVTQESATPETSKASDPQPAESKPEEAGTPVEKDASPQEKEPAEQPATSVIFTPTNNEQPEIKVDAPNTSSDTEKSQDAPMSPHPEDTPAPLFSSPATSPTIAASADKVDAEVVAANPADEGAQTGQEQSQEEDADPIEPVVGDYLKMQFVEHRVVPTILTFFFEYPWNNFLHNVVYDIVQQVFNGPMDRGYNPTLAVSLFEAADVTAAIIFGQQTSDESQAKTKTRMGYMGHLTLIAEEVVKFTERHPPELLSESVLDKVMSPGWINYVEGALAETRERDNAILGGVRPEVALGHRGSIGSASGLGGVGLSGIGAASSAGGGALAEAGLNGGMEMNENAGNGVGPFAISAGTLMSGFGSSSDEDEDEGEGEEDDANSEFRPYSVSMNSNNNNESGSLAPPSIPPPPPPPPPLNIPPSRARRQLAARLAMHQKNSESAQTSTAPLGEDEDLEDEDNQMDPFADAGDDFEDEEDAEASAGNGERGAWWRGVVGKRGKIDGSDSDEDEGDEDEEFGDFAMAEDEKGGNAGSDENVVLKPLAVNSNKDSSRGLSGLWPFSSKPSREEGRDKEREGGSQDLLAPAVSKEELFSPTNVEFARTEPERHAVEVKEAARRTSIEDPDDDDEAFGAEGMAGTIN